MTISNNHPMLARVIGGLTPAQMKRMHRYSVENGLFQGRHWFGLGIKVMPETENSASKIVLNQNAASPIAAAFNVKPDNSNVSWYSAKLDQNVIDATKHIVSIAGGEDGMEQFLKEQENAAPAELVEFIAYQYGLVDFPP